MKLKRLPAAILSMECLIMSASAANLEVGRPFPVVPLPSVNEGTPTSVADYRGEKLLVHIFGSW